MNDLSASGGRMDATAFVKFVPFVVGNSAGERVPIA